MQFSRVFSVLPLLFAFAFVFTSASPINETSIAARQTADVLGILTALHTQTLASAALIRTFHPLDEGGSRLANCHAETQALLNPSEENITPLFEDLISQIDAATAEINALEPSAKRQAGDDEVAALVALIVTDLTTTLGGLLGALAGIPTLGGLFAGLDASLNQLLKGLEGLLAGVLNLVATYVFPPSRVRGSADASDSARLLVNVAGLLRKLALGLTLASLGL